MRYILLLLVFSIVTLSGCKVSQSSQEKAGNSKQTTQADTIQLTEEEQLKYEYAFIEGVKQKLLGNFNNALGYFYKCLEIDKNAAAPRYEISQINTMMEDKDVALRYAREAVEKNPDNKWYLEHLAKINIRNENYSDAINQYERILETGEDDINYHFTLAQLYRQTQQYEKALEQLETIETRVGVHEQIAALKQTIYLRLGKKKEAAEEIKKLIRNYPNQTRYYGMLAEFYAQFQEFDKAEEMYDKLFAIDSTDNLGQISKIKYYERTGETEKALELFIKSIDNENIEYGTKILIYMNFLEDQQTVRKNARMMKSSLDSLASFYPEKYENHTLYADFYLKTNQFNNAIGELEYLVNSSNEKYIFWDQLTSLYSFTGNFDKMYATGKRGLEKYDSRPRLYLMTAMAANQLNKNEEAITLLKEGLVYIKKDQEMLVDFYTQLAEAYHRIEEYRKSDYYFEKVLNIDSDNILVLNNYSYYLSLRNEKLEKALQMSKKTIDAEPGSSIYLDTYAWILFKLERYDKALEYIEKAIQHGGKNDADVVEHYGDILFKTGKKEEALEQWKKAKSLGTSSQELLKKIESKDLVGEKK